MTNIPIITAPMIDPGAGRRMIELPAGLTIEEMVARALPGFNGLRDSLRVIVVNERGSYVAPAKLWGSMRPKPSSRVFIRLIPGKDALRSVLLIAVAVVATYFAPAIAGAIGLSGAVGTALVSAGLSIVGQLLVNALIPIEQAQLGDAGTTGTATYSIDGWRNDRRPGSPVPLPAGKHRTAPPFAASSYTEIIGDDQYVRAMFCIGYGPNRLSDHRIGDTPITEYEDLQIEVREGRPNDAPLSLYPEQVIEEAAGVDLVRPYPENSAGAAQTDQPTVETPVIRYTATNAARAAVLIGFPGGLFSMNDRGAILNRTVAIRLRQRLNEDAAWQEVETLNITNNKRETFLRQHIWTLPSRGTWQIEVTRMTSDTNSSQISDKTTLAAVQSYRPEYPVNLDKPLTLVAMRIRATHQLNGPLDAYNVLVEKEGLTRENDAWVTGFSRYPAAAYIEALTGPANPFPVDQSGIDMDQIAEWHDWCVAKGLKYDRIHEDDMTLGEMLRAICAAGRASPRHDGVKWGVVIDRPDDVVIDHLNPRNSAQFEWTRSYFTPPDGFRVPFLDATNNYEPAEMIVPWPGNNGDVALTESLELPGKVDPDEIWRETRRRMYEVIHRPDSFTAIQSGAARVATRGDLVMGSYDILSTTVAAARVKEVVGRLVILDEEVEIGADFGMRFKTYEDDADVVGTSKVVALVASNDATTTVRMKQDNAFPRVGSVVHIGPIATESVALKVRGIEGAQDFASRLIMVSASPEIDELTDADVPPEWNAVVGSIATIPDATLSPPIFTSIVDEQQTNESPSLAQGQVNYDLVINLQSDPSSGLTPDGFEIEWRVAGDTGWTIIAIPVADGGAKIEDVERGTTIELRAFTTSGQLRSDATQTITITLGVDDPTLPDAIEDEGVMVIGSLGHALIDIAIPSESVTTSVNIYRVPAGDTLDVDTHSVGTAIPVSAGTTITYTDGDATRSKVPIAGGFPATDGWSTGDGWIIADSVATHAPGLAGRLSNDASLSNSSVYRVSVKLTNHVAGSITIKLLGGTEVAGVPISAPGPAFQTLQSASGNDMIAVDATADFNGSIDELQLFAETAACVATGIWDYYVEPLNDQELSGPVTGPITTTIY